MVPSILVAATLPKSANATLRWDRETITGFMCTEGEGTSLRFPQRKARDFIMFSFELRAF